MIFKDSQSACSELAVTLIFHLLTSKSNLFIFVATDQAERRDNALTK